LSRDSGCLNRNSRFRGFAKYAVSMYRLPPFTPPPPYLCSPLGNNLIVFFVFRKRVFNFAVGIFSDTPSVLVREMSTVLFRTSPPPPLDFSGHSFSFFLWTYVKIEGRIPSQLNFTALLWPMEMFPCSFLIILPP